MEKPGFAALLICLALPALGQSRPVIPATVVMETQELMVLQDSVRWNRMARREAEKERDSLRNLLQSLAPGHSAVPATSPSEGDPTEPAKSPVKKPATAQIEKTVAPATKALKTSPGAAPATEMLPLEQNSQRPTEVPTLLSAVYWVVIGGSPNHDEANRMVPAYSLPPFQAQLVTAPNGVHRVCWGPFSDQKTALDVLREARKVRPDAWFWHQEPR